MKVKQTQLFYMKTQHTFYTALKEWANRGIKKVWKHKNSDRKTTGKLW